MATDINGAKAFSEGLCAVVKEDMHREYRWGFVDQTGKLVIDFQYKDVTRFINGIAQVLLADGKMGYIDKTGKLLFQ